MHKGAHKKKRGDSQREGRFTLCNPKRTNTLLCVPAKRRARFWEGAISQAHGGHSGSERGHFFPELCQAMWDAGDSGSTKGVTSPRPQIVLGNN